MGGTESLPLFPAFPGAVSLVANESIDMLDIYCDGGVIQSNPSPHGGTWAFCWVDGDQLLQQASGLLLPTEMGLKKITNNFTELYAAFRGITSVPKNWSGILWTDSKVTMHRLTNGQSFANIPQWLRLEALHVRRQPRRFQVKLVGGHPTRKELLAGCRADGTPVSVWNQWCDQECQRLAKEFLHATSVSGISARQRRQGNA